MYLSAMPQTRLPRYEPQKSLQKRLLTTTQDFIEGEREESLISSKPPSMEEEMSIRTESNDNDGLEDDPYGSG